MIINSRRCLWVVFIFILTAIAIIALKACTLSLPGFGLVITRCPAALAPTVPIPEREANLLLTEYDGLRAAIARAPECPVRPDGLPPDIPDPPEILRGKNIMFILDTTGSMKEHSTNVQRILGDVFAAPPEGAEIGLWGFTKGPSVKEACTANPTFIARAGESAAAKALASIEFEGGPDTLLPALLSIPQMVTGQVGRIADKPANVILIADGANACTGANASQR